VPAILLKLLADPRALAGIGLALILAYAGMQTLRLHHAKADLAAARAQLTTAKASFAASESLRGQEHAQATQAVAAAEAACQARIAAARRSAVVIRNLVEKPVATDPNTHCPLRALIGAVELRDALQPAA